MKIRPEKLNEFIGQFINEYVIPNAKRKNTLWKLGIARELGLLRVTEEHVAKMREAGVADADGNIDTDMMKRATDAGMALAGEFYVERLGITLYKADLDAFYRLVETGSARGPEPGGLKAG